MEDSEKNQIAFCGLFCGACEHFLGTETGNLESLAERTGASQVLVSCSGCRSDNVSLYCINCSIKKCCRAKSISHCGECNEFPCSPLIAFENDGCPHHVGITENLKKINDYSMEKFIINQNQQWSCKHCGEKYSWYQPFCEKCNSKLKSLEW